MQGTLGAEHPDNISTPPVHSIHSTHVHPMLTHGMAIMPSINYEVHMSTTRLTFGAALSTVTDTLNVVSTVANVATKSVGMLDAFVSNAAENQQLRMKLESASKIETLIEETALADTERQIKIESYLESNGKEAANKFKANQERLRKVLETK